MSEASNFIDRHAIAFHIAAKFEMAGKPIYIWKDHDTYPKLSGTDADFIVGPRATKIIIAQMKNALAGTNWDLISHIRYGHFIMFFIVRQNGSIENNDDFLQLDLFISVTANGLPILNTRRLINNSHHKNGIRWLNSNDAVHLKYLAQYLVHGSTSPSLHDSILEPFQNNLPPSKNPMVEAIGLKKTKEISSQAETDLNFSSIKSTFIIRTLSHRSIELFAVLRRKLIDNVYRFFHPPGLFISVSGPDGAGKTTLIDALLENVPRKLAPNAVYFHTRPFFLKNPFRRKKTDAANLEEKRQREKGLTKSNQFVSLTRLFFVSIDYILGYMFITRPLLRRGNLVIYDRYYYDYLVNPQARGINLPSRFVKLLLTLTPLPDRSFFVTASPEKITLRKGELNEKEATLQVKKYQELARNTPRATLLDSDQNSVSYLINQICEVLKTAYFNK